MYSTFLLILSLLSSTLALGNTTDSMTAKNNSKCINSTECQKPVGIESRSGQHFPALPINAPNNGSNNLRDFTSQLIYGNSILRFNSTEEQKQLFNLTGDEYSDEDMAIIMTFPMPYNTSSFGSNESTSEENSGNQSLNGNSSFGVQEKSGLNLSGRLLDWNELLTFLAPLNLLDHKLPTTPSYPTYDSTPKPVHEDPYLQVPVFYAERTPNKESVEIKSNYESVPMKADVKPPNLELSYS